MASVTKDVVKIINDTDYASLAAGASTTLANCEPIETTKATSLVLALRAGTCPGTLTFKLYCSEDNVTYDDVGAWWQPNTDWASGWTTTSAAENEHSPEIPTGPKYIKVIVTNDAGTAVTDLNVFYEMQTLG